MKWTDESPSAELPLADQAPMALTGHRDLTLNPDSDSVTQVTINSSVHQEVLRHLRSSKKELGGLLLGRAWGQPDEPVAPSWVEVLAAVPATDSSGTAYSLRMGTGVWSAANNKLKSLEDHLEPSASGINPHRIVGWYHSHPGLGAFFSATDRATQAAFFSSAYSVGWVIDPSDDSHACFVGPASLPVARCSLV